MVSRVVEDILLRLRDENEDRLLWLDQMCINQDDPVEKSRQVERMKDIFGDARRVIVSLGPHGGKVVHDTAIEPRDDAYYLRDEETKNSTEPRILVSRRMKTHSDSADTVSRRKRAFFRLSYTPPPRALHMQLS